MADVNGTDQEMPLYFILELLKNESDEFEKLQELCKKISKVLPDLEIPNKSNSTFKAYKIDERAKQQLDEKRRQDLADYSPVKTEDDDSCFYRALSFLCFGHQNRHRELRVRCVIEMATNSENYYNKKELLEKKEIFFSNRNSGSAHDASESENDSTEETNENIQPSENDSFEVEFKKNVCETCYLTKRAGFWEIQALGVILKRKIEVVCSSNNETELGQLEEALGVDLVSDEPPLTIMFLLDNKHVVPLKRKDRASDSSDDGRFDITSGDNLEDVMDKLNNLLDVDYDIEAKLKRKHLSIETLKSLTGPYEMANPEILGILKKGTVMFVSKLIEVQFQIKWNTEDGMPEQFYFYEFCDVEKQLVHLKYNPRRAHVFTELYRSAVDMNEAEFKQTFRCGKNFFFCPYVYVRVKGGWARICFSRETCEKVKIKKFEEDFSWMHKSLLKFVSEAEKLLEITLTSDKEKNYTIVKKAIEKPTLYWAVLQDTYFKSGDHLKLDEIGKTQVYVGKANGGIRRRWIADGNSHSTQMKKCAYNIAKMKCESFDVTRVDRIQLVDARLLLAQIKKEERAVFLMQTFKDSDDLKNGEKRHREGKRIVSGRRGVNIVPDMDTWTPKKMEYGMNKL